METKIEIAELKKLPIKEILNFNKRGDGVLDEDKKRLFLETFKIENQYKKFKVALNTFKISCTQIDIWLTPEEFQKIEQSEFSDSLPIEVLLENFKNRYEIIKRIREASIYDLLDCRTELTLDEVLIKKNPLDSKFIKKIILDNVSLKMFNKELSFKTKIIERKENFPEKGEMTYFYFSSEPVEEMKINKFHYIIDSNGRQIKIEKFYQSNDMFYVDYKIKDHIFKFKHQTYYGTILCKM